MRHSDILCPWETFPPLEALPTVQAVFLQRCPGVDVAGERNEVLARLGSAHVSSASAAGFSGMPLVQAEQVHGDRVAVVDACPESPVAAVDGLATNWRGVALGIYVADCAAVFLAERSGRAIALLHSGKKGSLLGIASRGVAVLRDVFGCRPGDLVAVISPCIRPPHYEIDFAEMIREQLTDAGVGSVHDARVCTASHPEKYYSYRREKGRTGRMLALMALR